MKGPDHPFALEPDELTAMVAGIRDAQVALGDGAQGGPLARGERGDVLARPPQPGRCQRDLPAGTALEREMITVKRPGYGIRPKHLDTVVGRTPRVDVEEDEILTWEML